MIRGSHDFGGRPPSLAPRFHRTIVRRPELTLPIPSHPRAQSTDIASTPITLPDGLRGEPRTASFSKSLQLITVETPDLHVSRPCVS